jgi:hypothetical protein
VGRGRIYGEIGKWGDRETHLGRDGEIEKTSTSIPDQTTTFTPSPLGWILDVLYWLGLSLLLLLNQ